MKKAIIYQKQVCVIIKTINIAGKAFAFFVDVNSKKIIYLKENHAHNHLTYVSLEKLVHLFPQYQCASVFNMKILLDTFTNSINYKILTGEIADSDEILELIYQFEKVMNDPYIRQMTSDDAKLIFNKQAMYEVTNTIKKLNGKVRHTTLGQLLRTDEESENDVFLSQNWLDNTSNKDIVYESIRNSNKAHRRSPIDFLFNNRVLNVYMVIMVVAVVGFISCLNMLQEWKKTGDETQEEIDNIIEEAIVEPEELVEQPAPTPTPAPEPEPEPEETYTVADDNKTPTVKKGKKYGADYWNYIDIPMINVNFNSLKSKNKDTVAWIFVNNTNVNYPVVQTTNNSFYLNHSFNRKSNVAGWIFGDYRSDFKNFKKNTVIYGHGRTEQVMFASLSKTLKADWYKNEENQIIKLATPTNNTLWKIFSIYTIKAEAYYLTHNFESEDAFKKWVEKMKSRSIYNFNTSVSINDKFLTLSTCKDFKGNRIVIQAKLVKNEKK